MKHSIVDTLIVYIGTFVRHDTAGFLWLVYGVTVIGGNIAAFIVFWTAFASHFENWRVLASVGAVAAGEATGDMLWFNLGRALRNTRFGDWIKRRLPGHDRVEAMVKTKSKKLLYLCKFAYGSAGVVVFLIGWSDSMRFKTFFKNSLMSILLALPVVFLMAYGVFSGLAPLLAVSHFKHIELIFLLAVIAFFVLEWLLSKAARVVFGKGED